MNHTNEQELNDELASYQRLMGLPLPLAIVSARVTCEVSWKHAYSVSANARRVYEALVPWFAHHEDGKLVRAEERQRAFAIRGVVIVDGRPYGVNSPKLVLATVSIEPDGSDRAHVTIETKAKVGRFSTKGARRLVITVCEAAAGEIAEQFSAESPNVR